MNDEQNDIFVPGESGTVFTPLEYSIGEICKCYYNDIRKNGVNAKVTQSLLKCQSFAKVIERHPGDKREYLVKLFDPFGEEDTKRVPGCCLRKVKVLPFESSDAVEHIGKKVRSKDGKDIMMLVSVSIDGDKVRINDIPADVLLKDFEFVDTGAPCGKIVMLKADEAFGNKQQ